MRIFGGYLSVLFVVFLFSSCTKDDKEVNPVQLRFISEEYKPFNYTDNSTTKGLAADLLKEVCDQLNMDCEIEFMPWNEGYALATETENTVLFTTALNATRRDLFKWAGPY